MTIKPKINQNSNEKNKDHISGHIQVDQQVENVDNHTSDTNNISESYHQKTQGPNDDDLCRRFRSSHKNFDNRHTGANRVDVDDGYSQEKLTTTYNNDDVENPHTSIKKASITSLAHSSTNSPKLHDTTANNSNIHAGINQLVSLSPQSQGSPKVSDIFSGTKNVNSTKQIEETLTGYNSGDEWIVPDDGIVSLDEWTKRDEQFINSMEKRGLIIKNVGEDGACLFRAISLQLYGDEEMHDSIRQQTMDYIYRNSEHFAHFVTEDINNYVNRKRNINSHGNHIEIQAMSELYNRPVELYCYQTKPINIFNSEKINNGNYPLRLSYMRRSHYNAILDSYNASVGVGLGLAGYKPESQTGEAIKLSEQLEIEQTMFEDKLKTTDWEATNEALQEQVARESYLQWCRDTILINHNSNNFKENLLSERREQSRSASCSSNTTIISTEAFQNSNTKQEPTATTYTESRFTTSPKTENLTASAFDNKNNIFRCSGSDTKTSACSSTVKYSNSSDIGESDDTDMSNTSSNDSKLEMYCIDNTSNSKFLRKNDRKKAKRLKRKYKAESENLESHQQNKRNLFHVKKMRDDTKHQHNNETLVDSIRSDENLQPCVSNITSINTENIKKQINIDKLPSTSKQNTDAKPVSTFYQSLLESSYTCDGIDQLTENEMIQKAIQMSRMNYIGDQKIKYG